MRSKEWPQVRTLRRQIGSKLHTINSGLNSRLKAKYGGQILTLKEKWRDFDELIQELKGNPAERDSELLADLLNELKDFDRELWPVANRTLNSAQE